MGVLEKKHANPEEDILEICLTDTSNADTAGSPPQIIMVSENESSDDDDSDNSDNSDDSDDSDDE